MHCTSPAIQGEGSLCLYSVLRITTCRKCLRHTYTILNIVVGGRLTHDKCLILLITADKQTSMLPELMFQLARATRQPWQNSVHGAWVCFTIIILTGIVDYTANALNLVFMHIPITCLHEIVLTYTLVVLFTCFPCENSQEYSVPLMTIILVMMFSGRGHACIIEYIAVVACFRV